MRVVSGVGGSLGGAGELRLGPGGEGLHAVTEAVQAKGFLGRTEARAGSEEAGGLGEALAVATVVAFQGGFFLGDPVCIVWGRREGRK